MSSPACPKCEAYFQPTLNHLDEALNEAYLGQEHLYELLQRYGRHEEQCPAGTSAAGACSCGLTDEIEAYKELSGDGDDEPFSLEFTEQGMAIAEALARGEDIETPRPLTDAERAIVGYLGEKMVAQRSATAAAAEAPSSARPRHDHGRKSARKAQRAARRKNRR